MPVDILCQLGNRVQHALRAFTAKDRKNLRMAAETCRENRRLSTEDAIREVGVGEAVTSVLLKKGVPSVVERTLIRPPSSQLGPITLSERKAFIQNNSLASKYDVSEAQVLLKWALQLNYAILPKSINIDRMRNNFDLNFTIDEEDMNLIEKLDRGESVTWEYGDPLAVK